MRTTGAHIMALCAPDTRQFQDLMFDLLGVGLPLVYSFLLSPDSFHLEMQTHPAPLYIECGTICLAGPHSLFVLSLGREFSLGLFKNTEAVKTLGTFRGGINACYTVRQTCILEGVRVIILGFNSSTLPKFLLEEGAGHQSVVPWSGQSFGEGLGMLRAQSPCLSAPHSL